MIIMICFYFQIENLQEQLRDKDKQLTNLKDRVKSLQTDSSNTDTALATLEEALSEKVMCSYATAHNVLLLQVKHVQKMSFSVGLAPVMMPMGIVRKAGGLCSGMRDKEWFLTDGVKWNSEISKGILLNGDRVMSQDTLQFSLSGWRECFFPA